MRGRGVNAYFMTVALRRTLAEVEHYVYLWTLAVYTAKVTGRVIFGQLWYPDPSTDDIFRASYERHIADGINAACPLQAYFA